MRNRDGVTKDNLRTTRDVARAPLVTFTLDGDSVEGHAGESLAAALFAMGHRALRRSPRHGELRGVFCLMGSCQECVLSVDGRRVPSCLEPVREGMVVVTGAPA